MKLAIIADTHFHNWKTFGTAINEKWGWSKRLDEQVLTVLEAIRIANVEREVDYFIHGADWVHTVGSISNEVANALDYVLSNLPLPLITGSGNHDTVVRRAPKIAHVITPVIERLVKKTVNLPNVKFVSYYDDVDYTTLKGYDLVVLHKTPIGCRVGNYTFTDGVDWKTLAKQNKQVAFAHIHQMQVLSDNCFVIGAPYHLTFGDIGDRGMWIIDTDSNTTEFIKLHYPEFLTVETPDLVKDDQNYYRVLHSEKRIDKDRVISVVIPQRFEERIKSTEFHSILREWLTLKEKDETYLLAINDILTEKLNLVKNFFKGRVKEVKIKDFGSVANVSYEVAKGFTLVTGVGETFDSNGVGKSTIIGESFCWCLFDETTKGLTGNDVIRDRPTIQKDCSVEVLLVDDAHAYKVKRTRKGGLEIYDMYGSKENLVADMKQTERQTYLESLLGFNKQVFMAACYFSQENLMMLTGLGDAEKTNMITDLLGFETYDDLYERVGLKISGFENDIKKLEESKVGLDKQQAIAINNVEFMVQSIETSNKQITEFDVTLVDLKKKIDDLNGKVVELSKEMPETKVNYDDELKELYDLKDSHNKKIEEVESEIELLRSTVDNEKKGQYSLQSTLVQYQKEVRKLEDEIEKLKNLEFGLRCDKCGSVISKENANLFIEEKTASIEKIKEEERAGNAKLQGISNGLSNLEGKITEQRNRKLEISEKLKKVEVFIRDTITERDNQNRRIQESKIEITKLTGEIKANEKLTTDYTRQLMGLKLKRKEFEEQKVKYDKELELISQSLKETDWRIDKTKKGIDVLDFWKVAFSPKGIRALLLDSFCNEINASVNSFLSRVSCGSMSIVMRPTAVLKSGEERNKIGMDILLDGLPRNYKSLSGGEKRRVDVSLCFGLNDWVSRRYGIPNGLLGVIVFDEVFSFLDKTGEESTAELLFEEGVNKALFVIDHALNLQSFADRIWQVKKVNQVSILEKEVQDVDR
jgi:DNA repair exonuclease SbcCD ATPase subunit